MIRRNEKVFKYHFSICLTKILTVKTLFGIFKGNLWKNSNNW